jgi:hypothetical protein
MTVELKREELAIVIDLLRSRMQELPTEARHTDDADYHDELRNLEKRTRELLRRLEGVNYANLDLHV